ncbi:hypothetical protein V8E51_019021 [Hyaloscypha variabilis]
MSSAYPSSNHATDGSVISSAQASLPSSVVDTADHQALSNARTSAYVTNPTASHVQHRHRSTQQAEASHTADMKAYLDDFDAMMARYEK